MKKIQLPLYSVFSDENFVEYFGIQHQYQSNGNGERCEKMRSDEIVPNVIGIYTKIGVSKTNSSTDDFLCDVIAGIDLFSNVVLKSLGLHESGYA